MNDTDSVKALNAIAGNLSRLGIQFPDSTGIEKQLKEIAKQLLEIKEYLRTISNNIKKQ